MSLWEQLKPYAWEIGAALVGAVIAVVIVGVVLFLAWWAVGAP